MFTCPLRRIAFMPILALGIGMAAGLPCRATDDSGPHSKPDAFEQNRRLGRGVNVLGYDPLWKDLAHGKFKADHFKLIHEAGFTHVRINLQPFRDAPEGLGAPAEKPIGEAYLKTLDWALDQALANHLMAVVDFHEFEAMAKDPQALHDRYLAAWRQLAEHCKDRPDGVLFELLNEPNGKLTPELWNQYLGEALAIVRKSSPDRTVVVGPGFWNGIAHHKELSLPVDDRNLIVTVHYYSPMDFTHQGAPWAGRKDKLGVRWNDTPEERAAIQKDFDAAQSWAKEHNRPVYLGEFGAYDKADMDSRVRYTKAVVAEAEKRGWSWAWWQFTGDFVLYDIDKAAWVDPIRDALLGQAGKKE